MYTYVFIDLVIHVQILGAVQSPVPEARFTSQKLVRFIPTKFLGLGVKGPKAPAPLGMEGLLYPKTYKAGLRLRLDYIKTADEVRAIHSIRVRKIRASMMVFRAHAADRNAAMLLPWPEVAGSGS